MLHFGKAVTFCYRAPLVSLGQRETTGHRESCSATYLGATFCAEKEAWGSGKNEVCWPNPIPQTYYGNSTTAGKSRN